MSDIVVRKTIADIFAIKVKSLALLEDVFKIDKELHETLQEIRAWAPYRISNQFSCDGKDRESRELDRNCWRYLVRLYELEKWMLCSDYKKLCDEIEHFHIPEFTIQNAEGWVLGLQGLIHENVKTLIQQVFKKLTEDTYYTGSRERKKRNNNGIDKSFIITTHDYSRIFGYWTSTPTITDDLEKACYILDGKSLPDITLMSKAQSEKIATVGNDYFSATFCRNGNTHYSINEEIRSKLNRWGPTGNILGEKIKIKIFE